MGFIDSLKSFGEGIAHGVSSVVTSVYNTGKDIVEGVFSTGEAVVTKVVDTGASVVTKVTDTGVAAVGTVVDTASGAVKGITNMIPLLVIGGLGIMAFMAYSGGAERIAIKGIDTAGKVAPLMI